MAPRVPQAGYGYAADLNRTERGNTATTTSLIRAQMGAAIQAGPRQYVAGSSDLAQLGYPAVRSVSGGRMRSRIRGGAIGTNPSGDPVALEGLRAGSTWGPATNYTTAQLTLWPPMVDPLTNDRSAMAGMHGGNLRASPVNLALKKPRAMCMRGGCLTCGGTYKAKRGRA